MTEAEKRQRARRRWVHLRSTFRTLGLLGRSKGAKMVAAPYWPEVHHPNHQATHGRNGNVRYLSARDRQKHLVTFTGNSLVIPQQRRFELGILQNTAGNIIFVVDTQRNFYVGRKNLGRFHHSSFMAGQPVLGAGTIVLGAGYQILEVNNHSGHYRPGALEMKKVALAISSLGGILTRYLFAFQGPVPMLFTVQD
ncbi:hypothetical protein BTJ40_10445 [Microbulbifer sp. A4B17]|uniref:hypothetical protein n=1 Tax=Microbulbifer sp. A4B17 TaxID=359370 RepID=UPI000D52B038|nr:hypothetical protein [Microbulbifer sp. A4B17]AWF81203.1 hypothetical protein BTJ40_10445 [Microbulbifer sp. A4B17]